MQYNDSMSGIKLLHTNESEKKDKKGTSGDKEMQAY